MPVKKVVKKVKKEASKASSAKEVKEAKGTAAKFSGQYFYAVGKRKTSVAQVRIYPIKEEGKSKVVVNEKEFDAYFPIIRLQNTVKDPLIGTGQEGKFDISVKVYGGGISSQAEAVRLGTARALVKFDQTFTKALKDLGFLTRDSRAVERKKPGLKKARRSPQWAKR